MQKVATWKKRLWAWCLVVTLLCGCGEGVPVVVQAASLASGTCGDIAWRLDSDGVLHFSGSGNFASYSADSVPWKSLKSEIKRVSFEMASVTGGDISFYFAGCTTLKATNDIPSGIKGLNGTFEGCTLLLSVGAIPDSVQSMCETFKDCSRMNCAVTVPENVSAAKGIFDGCTSLTKTPTILSNVIYDMEYMFRNTAIVTPPSIPGSAKTMKGCFYGCSSLTKAPDIPESVTNMAYCFYQCGSMKNAPVLPKKVEDIRYAFWNCSSMSNAPDIPLYVKNMQNCLVGCKSASGKMTIYAVVTEEENYNQFAGETMIYDVDNNPQFLGGGGTGLSVSYTNLNKEYIRAYLGTGWNSGALLYYDNSCGKLSLGTMLTADVADCEVESVQSYVYNGKERKPNPEVYYGNTQLVEGEDYIYSYANNKNAGTATVTINGIGTYGGSKTLSFRILPLTFESVKVTGYSGTYDGNPHSIAVKCDAGAKVEYGTTAGKYTTENCPEYILPGSYTTYYRVTKANYETVTGSAKVVIKTATLTVEAQGFQGEYDGNPHSIAVKCDAGAKVEYGTTAGKYTTENCPEYILPGSYTTYYQVTKPNYETITGSAKVVIKSATLTVEAQGFQGEYDGNPHSIRVKADEGATIRYGTKAGEYTTTVCPTYVNAGKYTIYYEVTKTGYTTKSGSKNVQISRKKIEKIEFPVAGTITYGECLGTSSLSGGSVQYGRFSWESPNELPTVKNKGYVVKFQASDMANYDYSLVDGYDNGIIKRTIPLTVRPVKGDMPNFSVGMLAEGDLLGGSQILTGENVRGSLAWENPLQTVTSNIAKYNVRFTPEDCENYDWSSVPGYDSEVGYATIKTQVLVVQYPEAETICYEKALEESVLTSKETGVEYCWEQPEYKPQESGYYDVIFRAGDERLLRKVWLHVEKAVPICETPQLDAVNYDSSQTLKEISLPEGWTWVFPEQVPCVESQGYDAIFTPMDTEHYKSVHHVIPLEVKKAEPKVEIPYLCGLTYQEGQVLGNIPLPFGWNWQDPDQLTKVGVNSYAAVFVPEDLKNYKSITRMVQVDIAFEDTEVNVTETETVEQPEMETMVVESPKPLETPTPEPPKPQETLTPESPKPQETPTPEPPKPQETPTPESAKPQEIPTPEPPKPLETRKPELLQPQETPVAETGEIEKEETELSKPETSKTEIPKTEESKPDILIPQETQVPKIESDVVENMEREEKLSEVIQVHSPLLIEEAKNLQEGETYDKKIAQWIRKIDQDNKKTTKVKIRTIRRKGKKVKIKWKKVNDAKGYQVVCTTKKKITSKTPKRYKKKCSITYSVKRKKKYYVRIRPVFKENGKRVYGMWSVRKAI